MKRTLTILSVLLLVSIVAQAETVINLKTAGSLSKTLSQEQHDTITSLTISGPLNSADIRLLRSMAGYQESAEAKTGKLRILDLSHARFVSDKHPYMVLDANKENLSLVSQKQFMGGETIPVYGNIYNETGQAFNWNDIYKTQYVLNNDTMGHDKELLNDKSFVRIRVSLGKENSQGMKDAIYKYDMSKIKGHKLKLEDGHYNLYCRLISDYFPMDMFYRCPNIQAVSVPAKAKINDQILVLNDPIRYYQFTDDKD